MGDGLRLAVTTLTVLPVRGPAAPDRAAAGRAMALAPLVGVLLGAVAAAVYLGLDATAGPLPAAAGAVVALALLSRGLHLDGLVDTIDGLASYRPPEEARRLMKEPGAGALGVAALVLVLLVQVTSLAALADGDRAAVALVAAVVAGRTAVTLACTPATPAATQTGLGALVAGTVARPVAAGVALLVVAAAAASDLAVGVGVLVALGVAHALRRHAVRRLGGVTGDVLGALVEVTTAVVLLVSAAG